jgi:diguanylate cyclase (GGDEF)-like protein
MTRKTPIKKTPKKSLSKLGFDAAVLEVTKRKDVPSDVLDLAQRMLKELKTQQDLAGLNGQISAAKTRQINELEQTTLTDPLSGLPNRRGLDAAFAQKVAESQRHPDRAAHGFIVIDADGFKKVNDTYGHEIGDRMIQHIAKILHPPEPNSRKPHHLLRAGDTATRLGGDEFVLILPEIGKDNGPKMLSLLQDRIQHENPFHFKDVKSGTEITLPVKLSMGLATFKAPDEGQKVKDYFKSVYQEADSELDKNKRERKKAEAAAQPTKVAAKKTGIKRAVRGALITFAKKF